MRPKIAPVTARRGKGRAISLPVRAPQLLLFYCAAFWLHRPYILYITIRQIMVCLQLHSFPTVFWRKLSEIKKGTSFLIQKVLNQFGAFFFTVYRAYCEFLVIFLYGILDGVRQGIFQRVCELWKHRQSSARLHLLYIDSLSGVWGLLMLFIPFK